MQDDTSRGEPAAPEAQRPPPWSLGRPAARERSKALRLSLVAAGVGCAAVLLALALFVVAVFVELHAAMESGRIPATAAQTRQEIPQRVLDDLRELDIVEDDETVLYFYSAALFSIEKDGNLFTDRRAISYETYAGELNVYSASYDEIVELEFYDSDAWNEDSTIAVYTSDDEYFVLLVSTEEGRDADFYLKLESQWKGAGVADRPAASER